MSLLIDTKYISLLSSQLSNFKKKGDYLWNFRCPICGDSQKKKNKSRGYLYKKKNDMYYKCHNCNYGTTMSNFIKEVDVSLHQQYKMERWKNGENGFSNYQKPKVEIENPDLFKKPIFRTLKSKYAVPISRLDDYHVAKRYLISRKIPCADELFYTDVFGLFASDLIPDRYENLKKDDARVLIPFYDIDKKLLAVQGRSISGSELRYITIKVEESYPKIYGLDKINFGNRIYVSEGPFDSMFLPNSVAMAGSDGICDNEFFPVRVRSEVVFVFDNECRNLEMVKKMLKVSEDGYSVCVFPKTVREKDINDMILSGFTQDQVVDIINNNTYSGLKAKLKINAWRRC